MACRFLEDAGEACETLSGLSISFMSMYSVCTVCILCSSIVSSWIYCKVDMSYRYVRLISQPSGLSCMYSEAKAVIISI